MAIPDKLINSYFEAAIKKVRQWWSLGGSWYRAILWNLSFFVCQQQHDLHYYYYYTLDLPTRTLRVNNKVFFLISFEIVSLQYIFSPFFHIITCSAIYFHVYDYRTHLESYYGHACMRICSDGTSFIYPYGSQCMAIWSLLFHHGSFELHEWMTTMTLMVTQGCSSSFDEGQDFPVLVTNEWPHRCTTSISISWATGRNMRGQLWVCCFHWLIDSRGYISWWVNNILKIVTLLLQVTSIVCLGCLVSSGTALYGIFSLPYVYRIRFMLFVILFTVLVTLLLLFLDISLVYQSFPFHYQRMVSPSKQIIVMIRIMIALVRLWHYWKPAPALLLLSYTLVSSIYSSLRTFNIWIQNEKNMR